LFTKEIDEALLDGRIDIAVHSMKVGLSSACAGITFALWQRGLRGCGRSQVIGCVAYAVLVCKTTPGCLKLHVCALRRGLGWASACRTGCHLVLTPAGGCPAAATGCAHLPARGHHPALQPTP
jgi:hypothetical protein